MSYTVLARKYRSSTFDDVVGQDHVAKTLKRAIESKRVAQRVLVLRDARRRQDFDGRILAKALNARI
jgi:DNA polymerase-3 subunit gamma/tau